MSTKMLSSRLAISLAVISLSGLTARGMNAQCLGAHNSGTPAPELRSLQEPDALNNEDFSDQAGSPEARDDGKNESTERTNQRLLSSAFGRRSISLEEC